MNKSASYSMLSIKVVHKTPATVTYELAYAQRGRKFSWGATTGSDRMVIDSLEIGEKYFIRVAPDASGTQHWIEAKKISDGKMANDVITQKVAAAKGKPKVNLDFLEW